MDDTTPPGPAVGRPFDLAAAPVGLSRTPGGTTAFGDGASGGGPFRVDGVTVGAAHMRHTPPHLGERHPDGDELLYLVAGAVDVALGVDEQGEGGEITSLAPGQAFVVPQGVWHRVLVREPSHLVHVTPGPRSEHQALPPDDPRWAPWRRPERLYHLALRPEWEAAVAAGVPYRRSTVGVSLEEEGFVHCSYAHQVQATADRFYAGRDDVVLLEIDPSLLTSPVEVEPSAGPGSEAFPHVFGPIDLAAVVTATPAPLTSSGHLQIPWTPTRSRRKETVAPSRWEP